MHFSMLLIPYLLACLASCVQGAVIAPISLTYSPKHEVLPLAYIVRCPLLDKYKYCKTDCSCTATGILECGSSASRVCYEGPNGDGKHSCVCYNKQLAEVSGQEPVAHGTPEDTLPTATASNTVVEIEKTAAMAAWPSMLACPKTMPLETKKQCWDKCACNQFQGKVCLDGAPEDCKTKCQCSESAVQMAQNVQLDRVHGQTVGNQLILGGAEL